MQCSDECLDRLAAESVVRHVPLGLDVDALQAQLVLVDDPVDATVISTADPPRLPVRAAVAHLDEHVEHGLLEERRVLLAEALEQLGGDVRGEPVDALLDLLNRGSTALTASAAGGPNADRRTVA